MCVSVCVCVCIFVFLQSLSTLKKFKIIIIIVIIIIIMKHFNRRSSQEHLMAQSAVNWRNIHSRGSHAFTRTHTTTVTTTLCEAPAQLLQNMESNFYFEVISLGFFCLSG